MEKKSKILIAVIAAVAVVVIAVAIILAFGVLGGGSFSNQVERGESYLESGDYDKAIEAFKKAIEADDTDEDAYIGLATAYHSNALFALAKQTLADGLTHVDSVRMRTLMEEWFGKSYAEVEVISDQQNAGDNTADAAPEMASVETEPADGSGISYNECILSGRVIDAFSGDSIANVSVKAYKGSAASGTPEETVTDGTGKYSLELSNGNYYVVIEKVGYNRSAEQVYISPSSSKTYYDVEMYEEGLNIITGRVIDAVTGWGISGAVVTAFGSDGSQVSQTTTGSSGDYSLAVKGSDSYYITVDMAGYITENAEVYTDGNTVKISKDIALSEEMAEDVIRIILTWGANPRDLDSHLDGTASDGTRTSVSYMSQIQYNRNRQKIAELDLDDVTGFGPETTTIYDINGSYEFYVVDFLDTGTMARLGATVKVYQGNSLVHTLSVPSDVVNVWSVLRINNGSIEITNRAMDMSVSPDDK